MKRHHYQIIDIARGWAIVLMFIYHISFDLNNFRFVTLHMNTDSFWLNFRTLIVSGFLLLMGISLAIATRKKLNLKRYLRRLSFLAVYAGLASLASYIMFPQSMIFFGILHFILLASIVGLAFSRFFWLNLVLGVGLLFLGNYWQSAVFDHPWLQWFGLMTHKPYTEDYVPFLPWFGVVLTGMFLGKLLFVYQKGRLARYLVHWKSDHTMAKLLAWAGRYSLHIYIAHQPVFIAVIYLLSLLRG